MYHDLRKFISDTRYMLRDVINNLLMPEDHQMILWAQADYYLIEKAMTKA